ncbi:MAG TPA: isoprenylcysteine carboxylmethyltransferase family protein [Desulfobacterales bacterium]|nr:isoprenylcysteine carboxylmethyltransferase family protein [Desulfobacterales bacterium]HIP38553.1 isoprenylcysteine carboxylmethyltransferase family protein [Desulfocapsa sulfexigens]
MIRIVLFFIGSLFLLYFSRRSLVNPGTHGFYRFFAFEGILSLVLINHPHWFSRPFTLLHLLSWLLLFTSIYFVVQSLLMLKKQGGHADREEMPENHSFENTVNVVEEGLYKYIRHPMYSSLLFLGWGAFLKQISPLTAILVFLVTGFLIAAARVEEKENVQFFGNDYIEYMKRTKMFVPWFL